MRKAWLLLAAIVIFAVGCFIGHAYHAQQRYEQAWAAGNKSGFDSGANVVENEWAKYNQGNHHYEFKQNGVSIFRFDLNSGESCWIQLGGADAREEDHLTSPMQQCPK